MLLTGLLFLPAVPAAAKPLNASSTALEAAFQSMSWLLEAKEWLDRTNNWFGETLGIDLYELIGIIVDFTITAAKLAITFGGQIIDQLRGLLAL